MVDKRLTLEEQDKLFLESCAELAVALSHPDKQFERAKSVLAKAMRLSEEAQLAKDRKHYEANPDDWYATRGLLKPQAKVDRPEVCPRCKGEKKVAGYAPTNPYDVVRYIQCPTCKGTGEVSRPDREKVRAFVASAVDFSHVSMSIDEATDAIIALLDPDQIRKQENKRIVRVLKDASYALDEKTWQALKSKEL